MAQNIIGQDETHTVSRDSDGSLQATDGSEPTGLDSQQIPTSIVFRTGQRDVLPNTSQEPFSALLEAIDIIEHGGAESQGWYPATQPRITESPNVLHGCSQEHLTPIEFENTDNATQQPQTSSDGAMNSIYEQRNDNDTNNIQLLERPLTTTSQPAVDDNVIEVRNTGIKLYKCDLCPKLFVRSYDRVQHRHVHASNKPHKCDTCAKCFISLQELRVYERVHTGKRPYKCNLCPKQFAQSSHLSTHKRIHAGYKPHKCDKCAKCFKTSTELVIHTRVHTGERPYKCNLCPKQFAQSSLLSTHKRRHAGYKPHKCITCAKCFITKHDLRVHERVHTGEKPYKCDVCQQLFSQSCNLNGHKRTHAGYKPYKCDTCAQLFTTSHELELHKQVHTEENP